MPHIHDKIDFTAEVFIVHKNRVLLRVHDKYKRWLSVGGHIELHEDPNEAAIREVKEEVGLDITLHGEIADFGSESVYKDLIPPKFLNRHRINESHEHVSFVYFATSDTDQFQQGETEISDQLHWFTLSDLDDPRYGLQEDIKLYSKKALEDCRTE